MQIHRLRGRMPSGMLLRGRTNALHWKNIDCEACVPVPVEAIFHEDNLQKSGRATWNSMPASLIPVSASTEKKEPLADN